MPCFEAFRQYPFKSRKSKYEIKCQSIKVRARRATILDFTPIRVNLISKGVPIETTRSKNCNQIFLETFKRTYVSESSFRHLCVVEKYAFIDICLGIFEEKVKIMFSYFNKKEKIFK